MDIAGLSMEWSAGKTQFQASTLMLGKSMDLNEVLGQGLVQMIDAAAMELSVNPNVGMNYDVRI